jgi:hypothetical protein
VTRVLGFAVWPHLLPHEAALPLHVFSLYREENLLAFVDVTPSCGQFQQLQHREYSYDDDVICSIYVVAF